MNKHSKSLKKRVTALNGQSDLKQQKIVAFSIHDITIIHIFQTNQHASRNFRYFFFSTDCAGVPFAKHLCVTCKSNDCSANVTCYVFAVECLGRFELNIDQIYDKDENGDSCEHGSKDGNCSNSKITNSSSIVFTNRKMNHSSCIV